jgi:hypothetical protein
MALVGRELIARDPLHEGVVNPLDQPDEANHEPGRCKLEQYESRF